LLELKALYPNYIGPDNAYVLLASVYRNTSATADEHAVLEELAGRDGDAIAAYRRLMELDEAAQDWEGVARNAHRMLAVNPLTPAPYRFLARAAEHLGHGEEAIAAYRGLALLDETDPAEVHYRLAKLLSETGKKDEARREVLKSLEEAPRFLESHRLLLDLIGDKGPEAKRTQQPTDAAH
jgi:tetratricopeptide (TPR) repeat protein